MKNYTIENLEKDGWDISQKNNYPISLSSKLPVADFFIQTFGNLRYLNDDTFYLVLKKPIDVIINDKIMSKIMIVQNGIFKIHLAVNISEEIFIEEYNEKIADSIDELIQKISSKSLYIPIKINPKTYDVLEKAGWYPDRKADISDFIIELTNNKIEIFPSVIKFFQEFYGLSGYTYGGGDNPDNNWIWKVLNAEEIINKKFGNTIHQLKNSSEICFPICVVDYGYIGFYITQNEKIYDNRGKLRGNNIMQGINSILNC